MADLEQKINTALEVKSERTWNKVMTLAVKVDNLSMKVGAAARCRIKPQIQPEYDESSPLGQ